MSQQNQEKITPEKARALLWRQGLVHWLLKPVQKDFYNSYQNCKDKMVVFNSSRRIGKSWTLCTIAIEVCLQIPNALVKYCCSKQKDAKGIIRPLIRQIIETCPKDLKPEFKTQEGAWVFPNGSRIELTGLDGGRAESVRGGSCNLAIIDEAGFVNDLEYIVNSILLPTTATTKGKIILSSTPPKTPTHPYITVYVNDARIRGNLVEKTIYDDKLFDQNELQEIIRFYRGTNSVEFRREFLCEIIKDENYAIIPEFNADLKSRIVKEHPRAPFYDSYVSMDVGMKDLTVVLFAWYDFLNKKLIVEDEFVINGQKFNTSTLANGIRAAEDANFNDKTTGEHKPPYLRVSDNNLILINDLWTLHGLRFLPTRKDDADAALNKVRIMLENEEIIINPKCKTLIMHLEAGVWNKAKTSYERSGDYGHFDAIDTLKYLVRNVQFNKNPYPAGYLNKQHVDYFKWNEQSAVPNKDQWNRIFNINKSTKESVRLEWERIGRAKKTIK